MVFAIPSIVVAASRIPTRQAAQPVGDALTLRANFCLDYNRPDCAKPMQDCESSSKGMETCIRVEGPECIKYEASPCSQFVAQCLTEFGEEADAKQAVNDCIIEKVASEGSEAEKQLVDAKRVLDLRASFCIDYYKPECADAIVDCKPKCTDAVSADQCKYKPNELESCVRDKKPACVEDEASPCSQAVVQCLGEFGKEADADQAVHDCIIEKVVSGTPEDEEAPAEPSQETVVSAACKKASAEYQVAAIEADCNEVEDDSINEVQRRDSSACGAASVAFQKEWKENNCEAELIGSSQAQE
ncbi:hypothetical protein BBO_03354 [Beauveria brongniartii RCEF 3172]|uniref:Uncharacterized protein n=1 Tax=Beauveria brongniartii RCEF 3172 TaxID=1081107 RepID=A0A167GLM1_9HYPO|nr:hypothetical protein BBO_03354 [Beauveria brongniartii RCEF 3172]